MHTVLVLGAGASSPYGFPTAYELREQILAANALSDDKRWLLANLGLKKNMDKTWKEFHAAYHYAEPLSIDAFLELRPEFLLVGKFLIAYLLCQKEEPNLLRSASNGDNWYAYLFKHILSLRSLTPNILSIVTFNYDRSLEEYLYWAFCQGRGMTEAACAAEFRNIPIMHIYGSLGRHPISGEQSAVPYTAMRCRGDMEGLRENLARITRVMDSLKLMYDRDANPDNEAISEIMSNAQRVMFLGFGYDPTNIKRLNLSKRASIDGTCYGMTDHEIKHAEILLQGEYPPLRVGLIPNYQNLMFLRSVGL